MIRNRSVHLRMEQIDREISYAEECKVRVAEEKRSWSPGIFNLNDDDNKFALVCVGILFAASFMIYLVPNLIAGLLFLGGASAVSLIAYGEWDDFSNFDKNSAKIDKEVDDLKAERRHLEVMQAIDRQQQDS